VSRRIERVRADLLIADTLRAMRELPDASIHAVVADPPFSSGTRREAAKGLRRGMTPRGRDGEWFGTDTLTARGFEWLMRECALEWHRLLVRGGHALIFIDWRMAPHLSDAIESADLRRASLIVWDKTYFGMGGCFRNQHEFVLHFTKGVGRGPFRKDQGNVIPCPPVRRAEKEHDTPKPDELLGKLITVVTDVGETVLDNFAGSGSTGEAAWRTGRRSILIERDGRIAERAAQRLERVTLQESFALELGASA
jgi:site-specific DNA-methyltransferase (adenine-specific)